MKRKAFFTNTFNVPVIFSICHNSPLNCFNGSQILYPNLSLEKTTGHCIKFDLIYNIIQLFIKNNNNRICEFSI